MLCIAQEYLSLPQFVGERSVPEDWFCVPAVSG